MIGRIAWTLLVAQAMVESRWFQCKENKVLIRESSRCNGKVDCLYGSDESFVECKIKRTFEASHTFYCASGAEIRGSQECNVEINCADGSDESPSLCNKDKEFKQTIRGECKKDELEYMNGECIPGNNICNGAIDCTNGRDESVELCMEKCEFPDFRCANGKCIRESGKICDNKFDCIDGSDESFKVCETAKGWIQRAEATCIEPTMQQLRFTEHTKYYSQNGTRFVYANQPVSLECYDPSIKLDNHQWNVCLPTGEWRYDLTRYCTSNQEKFVNGCGIKNYSKYKDRLRIYECNNYNCSTKVNDFTPTLIRNKVLKFECEKGYTLLPNDLTNMHVRCGDSNWNQLSKIAENATCVKKCKTDILFCRDSMTPHCLYENKTNNCNDTSGILPQTKVIFKCNHGFKMRVKNPTIECLEDGSWQISSDMDKFCKLECATTPKIGKSMNAPPARLSAAPWTVAIYRNQGDDSIYELTCTGVLIRPNLVLTAAHCVNQTLYKQLRVGPSTSRSRKVNEAFGRQVEDIIINQYFDGEFLGDTALLKLNSDNYDDNSKTICLPWDFDNDNDVPDSGIVYAWQSNKTPLNLTLLAAYTSGKDNDHFQIMTVKDEKFCKGDSGSGFVNNCINNNVRTEFKCIYGIISYENEGGERNSGCTKSSAVANLLHYFHKDFIMDEANRMANDC